LFVLVVSRWGESWRDCGVVFVSLACVFCGGCFWVFQWVGCFWEWLFFFGGVVTIGIWNASKNFAELIAEAFLGRISKSLEAAGRQ